MLLPDERSLKPAKSPVLAPSPLLTKPQNTPRVYSSNSPDSAYQAYRQGERDSSPVSKPKPAPAPGKDAILHQDDARETRRGTAGLTSSNQTAAKLKPNLDHYRVELRAWIPQANVVDPLATVNKVRDAGVDIPGTETKYESHYRGDNHAGYDGGWRARSYIEFDYSKNTKKITNFKFNNSESDIAVTHRDWSWYRRIPVPFVPFPPFSVFLTTSKAGTETGRGSGQVYGQQSDSNSFSLGFSATNRVQDEKIPGKFDTPSIDSRLSGFISAGGKTMTLKYDTDQFPSHGFQVMKNGRTVATEVVNDVSRVEVQGGLGAANIATRLSFQNNEGEKQISIG